VIKRGAPAPVRAMNAWDGLLLVDKPSGPTSHDVVDRIRRHFRLDKVGHGGTLDPMATGLLVILLGKGTKLSNYIMGSDKIYEGTMRFGVTTDTDDLDGQVLSESDASGVTQAALEAEMRKWVGDIMQTPPMVSAVKKDGVPLYKLARKGQTVEREPRLIHIYDFALLDFTPPSARFRLKCTKGTYVRAVCADVGRALGCGAFLEQLRRTRSGSFDVERALTMPRILEMQLDELVQHVIPVYQVRMGGPGDEDHAPA